MKKIIPIICVLFYNTSFYAQTASGDIEPYLWNLIDIVPGNSGNNYTKPLGSQLIIWNEIINLILDNDLVNARLIANGLNYQLTEFTDTTLSPNQTFYVLEEKLPQSNYWGSYVFSKTPKRGNLVIQAPHVKQDINTGFEAVYCFKENVASALFINGTDRCNHTTYSSCGGLTSNCISGSATEAYRISDQAHNIDNMFQKTTENLFANLPSSVFTQLHGFSPITGDPDVIISNGSRETPAIDYAVMIQDALFVEDNTLTFELPHININWNRLTAFSNTQGRLINYSTENCNQSAEGGTGRFIHIEQELSKLRVNSLGCLKMSNALASAFIEDSDGDGLATGSNLNDSDYCDPDPFNQNCGVCDNTIFSDNFDISMGNWIDDGNNTFPSTINALGEGSIRLKHGIEAGNPDLDVDPQSSMFTNPLNLSSYTDLKIELSYFSPTVEGYTPGDDFILEVSTDNSVSFTII